MRRWIIPGAFLAACLWPGTVASAQEGHPLKGSWSGDWGSNGQRTPLLIVMNFENGKITGTINPGTDNLVIRNATLDPNGWVLHLDAETKDKAGQIVKLVMD